MFTGNISRGNLFSAGTTQHSIIIIIIRAQLLFPVFIQVFRRTYMYILIVSCPFSSPLSLFLDGSSGLRSDRDGVDDLRAKLIDHVGRNNQPRATVNKLD